MNHLPPMNARLNAGAILTGKDKVIDLMSLVGPAYLPGESLTSAEARHLGYVLLALASEADVQSGYLLALRSHKTNEEEIQAIMVQAADVITAARAHS